MCGHYTYAWILVGGQVISALGKWNFQRLPLPCPVAARAKTCTCLSDAHSQALILELTERAGYSSQWPWQCWRQRPLSCVAVELYPARVLTFSPGALQAWLWPPLVLFVQAPLTLAHFLTWFFSLSSDSVNSLQFSCSVLSNSLWPPGLQHTRLPCPSPTPRAYSNSCPSRRWCHATISSSVVPFSSRLQSFPASGSFPMSQFFTSGGQSIGVSASASVLPMNIQDLFPLRLTGWISLQSKGLSGVFSNTTVQKHQFFGTQLSLNYLSVNSFSVELFIDHHQPEVVSVAYT